MVLTYLANLAWLVVTCGMAIPLVYSLMMQKICDTEFDYQKYQPGDTGLGLHCFNMTRLGNIGHLWMREHSLPCRKFIALLMLTQQWCWSCLLTWTSRCILYSCVCSDGKHLTAHFYSLFHLPTDRPNLSNHI